MMRRRTTRRITNTMKMTKMKKMKRTIELEKPASRRMRAARWGRPCRRHHAALVCLLVDVPVAVERLVDELDIRQRTGLGHLPQHRAGVENLSGAFSGAVIDGRSLMGGR